MGLPQVVVVGVALLLLFGGGNKRQPTKPITHSKDPRTTRSLVPQVRTAGPVLIYGDSQTGGFGRGIDNVLSRKGISTVRDTNSGKSTRWLYDNLRDGESSVRRAAGSLGQYDVAVILSGGNDVGNSGYTDSAPTSAAQMTEFLLRSGVREVVYVPALPPTPGNVDRITTSWPYCLDVTTRADGRCDADYFLRRAGGAYMENRSALRRAMGEDVRAVGGTVLDVEEVSQLTGVAYPNAPDGLHATVSTGTLYGDLVFGP